jgi:hypothetical protein
MTGLTANQLIFVLCFTGGLVGLDRRGRRADSTDRLYNS